MKNRNFLLGFKSKTIFVFCITLLFASGLRVKAQESEIEKIVKQVSADSQNGSISDYSYLMKFSFERHKTGGRKFTRLYEAIIPSTIPSNRVCNHSLILLEDTEKLISKEEIRISRENISKELVRTETMQEAKQEAFPKPKPDESYWTMGFSENSQRVKVNILELLKDSRLSNFQRKQIGETNIVVIDFAPNPAAKLEKSLSYLAKIEGQIWIDETAQRIIRVEGFALGTLAAQKEKPDGEREKEAILLFVQSKIEEKVWFPETVRLNLSKLSKFYDPVEFEVVFTQYKKAVVSTQYQEANFDKNRDSVSKNPK